jgi:hypothetical protein
MTASCTIDSANAITISAENITLDCQNFWINTTTSGNGIYSNQFNTTIKNCNVNSSTAGIYITTTTFANINNTNVLSVGATGGTTPTSADGIAILLTNVNFSIINNTLVDSASYIGLGLVYSGNNTIQGINATSNIWDAIYLGGSSDNSFKNISLYSIHDYGINMDASSRNGFTNMVLDTYDSGMYIDLGGYNNVSNTTINNTRGSAGYGIIFAGASTGTTNNKITNCSLTAGYGAVNVGGTANTIEHSNLYTMANSPTIEIGYYNSNIFTNNTITGTTVIPVISVYGNGNIFINNTIIGNNWTNDQGSNTHSNVVMGNAYYFLDGTPSWDIYDISDTNGDGWADTGSDLPFDNSLAGAVWTGNGNDEHPWAAAAAPTVYANLTVNCGTGGTCEGNATDFEIPANMPINATASTDYTFSNWSVSSGNCTITDALSASTNAEFLLTTSNCEVLASFNYTPITPPSNNTTLNFTQQFTFQGQGVVINTNTTTTTETWQIGYGAQYVADSRGEIDKIKGGITMADIVTGFIVFGGLMWVAAAYLYLQRNAVALAYPFYIFGIILFATATVASAEAAAAAENYGTADMMFMILFGLEWMLVLSIAAAFVYMIIMLIDKLAKFANERLEKRSLEGKM